MKFTTYSGTVYEIKDIVEHTDTQIPHFTGLLARISDHAIANLGQTNDGSPFDNSADFYEVIFHSMPAVGESFYYIHPIWDGSVSSQIQTIEE